MSGHIFEPSLVQTGFLQAFQYVPQLNPLATDLHQRWIAVAAVVNAAGTTVKAASNELVLYT